MKVSIAILLLAALSLPAQVAPKPSETPAKKSEPAAKPIPPPVVKPIYQAHINDLQALMKPHTDEIQRLQNEQNEVLAMIRADNPDYDLVQTPNGFQLVAKVKPEEPKK